MMKTMEAPTFEIPVPTTRGERITTGFALWKLALAARNNIHAGDIAVRATSLDILNHFADVVAEISTLDRDTVVASMRAYREYAGATE